MIRPKQKIPTKDKFNEQWLKDNGFYWDSVCKDAIDEAEAMKLYRAANGELMTEEYVHITNPLNTDNDNYKRYPAKLKNVDIINSIVIMLMGEKRKRGLNYTVIARNSDIDTVRTQIREAAYDDALQAEFINAFIQFSQETGRPVEMEQLQQMTAEEIEKKVNSIPDRIAIQGQEVLDYILDYNQSFEVFMECWYHFIVTGRAFTYRDVYRDEVIHEAISPLEMKFYAFSDVSRLEEAEAHVRRKKMSVNQVIDKFQGMKGFTEDVEKELEAKLGYTAEAYTEIRHMSGKDPGHVAFNEMWGRVHNTTDYVYSDDDGVEVKHVVWSSLVKVGLLSSVNIFGELIQEEVDEDFIPLEGEVVDWVWVEQKWHLYIIDDKHVVGGEPLLNCTGNYFNPKAKKSVYNGKILGNKHTNPRSIVSKGMDHQFKYNVVHYYIERLVAKNLDSLTVIPLSLIKGGANGLGLEASMYYAQALSMLFVDDSSKTAMNSLNGLKTLNSNLGQSLNAYFGLLNLIKQEWEDSVGVTAPRKGQMNSSDGKAVTENAIFRSSIMTEEYFAQFENMQEGDLNFLLESSKYAFSEGKHSSYVNRADNSAAILNVDGELLNYHDFLVRVSSSGKDLDDLNQVKNLAQAFAQNADGRFTPALKALKGNNISQIIEVMENLENEIQQQIEASKQADRESQERVAQMNMEATSITASQQKYKVDADNATKLEIARINADQKARSEFFNPENGEQDSARILEASAKREVEMRKIEADLQKSANDNETKKYVADKQLSVAKENKSQ